MKILNLTQHVATSDQIAAGVVEPDATEKRIVQHHITFDELPSVRQLEVRARSLAALVRDWGYDAVMIGGAPYFMSPLETALKAKSIVVLYAFSVRRSVDERQPDGSVKKTQVFRHVGFVQVPFPSDSSRDSFSDYRWSRTNVRRGALIGEIRGGREMKIEISLPKARSDAARALADRRYYHRVIRDKKKYTRKGRGSSTRKFEDSFELEKIRELKRN